MMPRFSMKSAIAAAITASAMLAGCHDDDYLSRRDLISLGAGDAQATNAVTHTIDPWPSHATNTDIDQEGERARVAIERYQQNKSVPPKGLNTTQITGQAGPGAQANAQIRN